MPKLNLNQAKTLLAIADFEKTYGFPPSTRDIQEDAGISSTSVVAYNRDRLAQLGLITFRREISRSIRMTEEGWAAVQELRS